MRPGRRRPWLSCARRGNGAGARNRRRRPTSFDLVHSLAAHAVAPGRAGHALAVVDRGGESLVAQVLAALRRGRGLIVAGRAGLLPCIHDTTTATNPIVVNHAPEHLSAMPQNMRQLSARTRYNAKPVLLNQKRLTKDVNPSKPLNFNEITRLSINAHFSV